MIDFDPNNPYHYHTSDGKKIVISIDDWEKYKDQPYFQAVRKAVEKEQAAHPVPEYDVNQEDLAAWQRQVGAVGYNGLAQNYREMGRWLPEGYSFDLSGMIVGPDNTYYVQSGFNFNDRFKRGDGDPLRFSINTGTPTQRDLEFIPVDVKLSERPVLPIDKVRDIDLEKNNLLKEYAIRHPTYTYNVVGNTGWPIVPPSVLSYSIINGNLDFDPSPKTITKEEYDARLADAIKYNERDVIDFYKNLKPIYNYDNAKKNIMLPEITVTPDGAEVRGYDINAGDGEYAKGGSIHIDPSKRGTFTAAATKHNMGVQEFASKVLANKDDYSHTMVKKANFARNFGGHRKDEGGVIEDYWNMLSIADRAKWMKYYINQGLTSLKDIRDRYNKYKGSNGGPIVTERGQWDYPGQVTIIPSNRITMKGVDYPVLGVSDVGDSKIMYPNGEYSFNGESVTEYPLNQYANVAM